MQCYICKRVENLTTEEAASQGWLPDIYVENQYVNEPVCPTCAPTLDDNQLTD